MKKMKRIICLLLAAVTLLALPTTAAEKNIQFKDVSESFWGYSAIMSAADAGLVNGKSANSDGSMNFAPNDTITRAEFLTTVLRFFHAEEAAAAKAGAKWWTGYYDLAIAKGILKEGELDSGDMDKAMTREEMALVLSRTAPSMDAYKSAAPASVSSIPDYFSVTNVYKSAVRWVYGAGLIQGMDDKGTFAPQNSLTRAQSATILAKLVAKQYTTVEHLIPAQEVAETEENRFKAIAETAWAYYRKNPYVQYDILNLNEMGRGGGARTAYNMNNTPEMAGPQQNIYGHCHFYAYQCIYHAFDHEMMNSWPDCYVTQMVDPHPLLQPYLVWRHDNDNVRENELKALEEMLANLQPGDVLSYTRKFNTTPHVILWMGDVTGDGVDDMLHISGTPYNTEKQTDPREAEGAVFLNYEGSNSAVAYFSEPTAYDFITNLDRISILRWTDTKHSATAPISERAKTRILYPGLDIFYEVEGGIYGSVAKGTELTYTLKLKNTSTQDHKGIQVNLPVPENATVSKIDGKAAKNGIVSWTVDIPAGKEVTHTYTVKATGNVGDVIDTGVGYVHAIPLPVHTTAIVSKKGTSAEVSKALSAAKRTSSLEFLNSYLAAQGISVTVPDIDVLQNVLFDKGSPVGGEFLQRKTVPVSTYKVLDNMVIPWYFGGMGVYTEGDSLRVKEIRAEHMEAGDILIWRRGNISPMEVAVHNGTSFLQLKDGSMTPMTQADLDRMMMYRVFVCLRPTQGA